MSYSRVFAYAGIIGASALVTLGTFWAFDRGAHDFDVFYSSWRLVLQGRGMNVYQETPDRFLYAPGFAWLFVPLAWLPFQAALAVWCFAKAAVVGYVVREFGDLSAEAGLDRFVRIGLTAWGVILLARPLLIDFQYGQVNLFMLGACVWALAGHFRRADHESESAWHFIRWFLLAITAMAKLIPLPLLAVPWVVATGVPRRKLNWERAGSIAGVLLILTLPMISLGPSSMPALIEEWRKALISRGFPMESHNQSFGAFLWHYFSGVPTRVAAEGMHPLSLGAPLLSEKTIAFLSYAWSMLAAGAVVAWILLGSRRSPLCWIAVAVALLILPSHLVWKPYFVMCLPLAMIAVQSVRGSLKSMAALVALFVVINLSGFDVLGHALGARIEAASFLLWSELVLLSIVAVSSLRDPIAIYKSAR